jgi:hypothetical protein
MSNEQSGVVMRIKIVQSPRLSSIDGVCLDCFHVGQDCEVGNSIGALFLAEGWAEPVPLDAPSPIEPFAAGDPFDSRALYPEPTQSVKSGEQRLGPVSAHAIAADMSRYARPGRRRCS